MRKDSDMTAHVTWLSCKHLTRISCYSSGTSASYTNTWTRLWQTTQMSQVKLFLANFMNLKGFKTIYASHCLIFEMVYFSYVHSMKSGISRQEIDKEKQSYLLNGSCFHWLSGMANISYGCLNHQLQASNHVQTLECVKAVTYPSWWTWSRIVVLNRRALGCCWSVMGVWQWSNVAQWCSKEETHSFGSN